MTLKELRKAHKLTQPQMAKILGLKSPVSISYIETGKQKLKLSEAVKLSDMYNIPITEIQPEKEFVEMIDKINYLAKAISKLKGKDYEPQTEKKTT